MLAHTKLEMGKLATGSLAYYLLTLRRRPMRHQPAINCLSSRIVLGELISRTQLPSPTSPRSPSDFPQAEVYRFSSSPASGHLGFLRATLTLVSHAVTVFRKRSYAEYQDEVKSVLFALWVSQYRDALAQPLQHSMPKPCLAVRQTGLTERGNDRIPGHPMPDHFVRDFALFASST